MVKYKGFSIKNSLEIISYFILAKTVKNESISTPNSSSLIPI
jgi:hypothetical protein